MKERIFPFTASKSRSGEVSVWYINQGGRSSARIVDSRLKIPLFRWVEAELVPSPEYGPKAGPPYVIKDFSTCEEQEQDPGIRWAVIDLKSWPTFEVTSSQGVFQDIEARELFPTISYFDPDLILITTRSRRGLEAVATERAGQIASLARGGTGGQVKNWGLLFLQGRIFLDPLDLSHLIGFYESLGASEAKEIVEKVTYLMSLGASLGYLYNSSFAGLAALLKARADERCVSRAGAYSDSIGEYICLAEGVAKDLPRPRSKAQLAILSQLAEYMAGSAAIDDQVYYACGGRVITPMSVPKGLLVDTYVKALIGSKPREWAFMGSRTSVGLHQSSPYFSPLSRLLEFRIVEAGLKGGAQEAKRVAGEGLPVSSSPFYYVVTRDEKQPDGTMRRERGIMTAGGRLVPPLSLPASLEALDSMTYEKERAIVTTSALGFWGQTKLELF